MLPRKWRQAGCSVRRAHQGAPHGGAAPRKFPPCYWGAGVEARPGPPLTGSSAGGTACPRPGTAAPGARAARRLRTRCWGSGGRPAPTGDLRRAPRPAGNRAGRLGVGARSPAILVSLMAAAPHVHCGHLPGANVLRQSPGGGQGARKLQPREGEASLGQDGNMPILTSRAWASPPEGRLLLSDPSPRRLVPCRLPRGDCPGPSSLPSLPPSESPSRLNSQFLSF